MNARYKQTACCNNPTHLGGQPGAVLVGLVDPLGSDLCGLCQHRWKRKQASR